MINYVHSSDYLQESLPKSYQIVVDNGEVIGNSNIHSEDFNLIESICSEPSILLGCCESNSVEFKISNYNSSLKSKKITISQFIGSNSTAFQIGEYYVESDKVDANSNARKVVAYDSMRRILNTDMDEWYTSLSFPMSMLAFRNSFFNYFGIEQEPVSLIADELQIVRNTTLTSLTGKNVITSICAINACFGNIGRNGKFKYVFLGQDVVYEPLWYINANAEDFLTDNYTAIRFENGENSVEYGQNKTNTYVMTDNILFESLGRENLMMIAPLVLKTIEDISYRPFELEMMGYPCLEVGDKISFTAKDGTRVNSYVLERTLTGIQALKDRLSADGEELSRNNQNSVTKYLDGKINEISNKGHMVYKRVDNENVLDIGENPSEIFFTNVTTERECIAMVLVMIPYEMDNDGDVRLFVTLDNVPFEERDVWKYSAKGKNVLTIVDSFDLNPGITVRIGYNMETSYYQSDKRVQESQINALKTFAETGEYPTEVIDRSVPNLHIEPHSARCIIFSQGLVSNDSWDGTLLFNDGLPHLAPDVRLIDTNFVMSASASAENPHNLAESLPYFNFVAPLAGFGLNISIE